MAIKQAKRLLQVFTPFEENHLLMRRLRADEAISNLFRFELDLVHEETKTDYKHTQIEAVDVLGHSMTVKIEHRDKAARFFNGIVIEFSQGGRDERFSHYKAILVPEIWVLTQNIQSRIFQQLPVPEILKKVLEGFNVKFEIQGDFHPRDYCVQYRESDFDFMSRIMEEEGIYYYFEHTDNAHKMILANTAQSHRDCPVKADIPYKVEVTEDEDFFSSVASFEINRRLQPGKVTLWDHCFELPGKNLESQQPTRFSRGGNEDLEVYDYPGIYAQRFDGIAPDGGDRAGDLQKIFEDGRRTVQIRMQELDAQYRVAVGVSDCCTFTAGYRFRLTKHKINQYNQPYALTSVQHEAVQSPDYVSNDEVLRAYGNTFTCIAHGAGQTPFRPQRKTRKPTVLGSQTATVVGPAGEEIFTDKYGRVKVQFHWDREAQGENDSCWVRVAQIWAGNQWGAMYIPRIGHEVIVDFLEGDPDQPIIIGSVYNAANMPHYKLPDEKTKSYIKSSSSKGGKGFNELRFEDKKGEEQVFMHGERDLDVRIKNDRREIIGNDRHLIVTRDKYERVKRDEYVLIERDYIEETKRDYNLKIGGKTQIEIDKSLSVKVKGGVGESFGCHSEDAGSSYYLKAQQIVIEATAGLTLNVGGNFITIDSSGIYIQGTMVMINSGGAALPGTPANIVPPAKVKEADVADVAEPGKLSAVVKGKKKSKRPWHKPEDKKNKDKTHWIEVKMVDEEGKPAVGESYQVILPDNETVESGTLDEKGLARVDKIDPGNCQITFPNLDGRAWKKS